MPRLVAERAAQAFAQRERAVFDGVVLVDVQVALAVEAQREAAVLGQLLQHVIEEADAGCDLDGRRWRRDRRRRRSRVSFVLRSVRARRAVSLRTMAGQVSSGVPFRRTFMPRIPGSARRRGRCPDRRSWRCVRRPCLSRARSLRRVRVLGLRQSQASVWRCGQTNTASNSMPCELKASSMNWCAPSKCACGKLAVPRPSWLVTMTKR